METIDVKLTKERIIREQRLEENKQKAKRRYNLHYTVRKKGGNIKTHLKTIFLAEDQEPPTQALTLVNEYDYVIQSQLEFG